ncbi:hypothetical protein CWRG_02120 [Chthonomonas calidirosea]|uniref:hypothetical protein n=1 Tax=Chthonomonas calidirosea TaxID=454171 RepID=UPI0006DD52EA|nr:hypothetical protein [Chthonomonas calidirosea]CEK18299.1 hypothetical protein CWRG_02120 [Chthonomonas calidirosea]
MQKAKNGLFFGLVALSLSLFSLSLLPYTLPTPAHATVEYARKENKPCVYCHVSAAPGVLDPTTGKVNTVACNERGFYYETHNHSFAGYVETPQINPKALTGPFRFGWAVKLPTAAQRVVVADVKGDQHPLLITLSPSGAHQSELALWSWNGKTFVKESALPIAANADMLQVGHFAGNDQPVLIVTGDGVRWWNGKQFAFLPAPNGFQLIGAVRLLDGTERLLGTMNGSDLQAYRVDLSKAGSAWLADPQSPPQSHEVQWAEMHGDPKLLEKIGMPTALSLGGLIGVWNLPTQHQLFLYLPKLNQDLDTVPDPDHPGQNKFVLKSQTWCVGLLNATNANDAYYTPPLAGKVYDVARESPIEPTTPGLLVLTKLSTPNTSGLYFFPLTPPKP